MLRTLRTVQRFTPVPIEARIAGSTTTAANAAISTALIPPKPMLRRKVSGNSSRPESAAATVSAETATVLPAVSTVRRVASIESCPPASSSRKRPTISRP